MLTIQRNAQAYVLRKSMKKAFYFISKVFYITIGS